MFQKTIKRLGEPYGTCDDGQLFKENVGFQYSRQVNFKFVFFAPLPF